MSTKPAVVGGFILGALALGVAAILFFGGTQIFAKESRAVVFFDESVAGLTVGAPVTFHGVQIGSVESIVVQFSANTLTARVPVFLQIDSSRITWEGKQLSGGAADFDRLVGLPPNAHLPLPIVLAVGVRQSQSRSRFFG